MNKIAYHPDGKHIITFEEGPHTYTDNYGVRYMSATSFIGRFFEKFDSEKMALECSIGDNPKYADRSSEDILSEWDIEGERGRNEGTNIHHYAEGVVSKWPSVELPEPLSERCYAIFKQADKAIADLYTKYEFVGAEVIVFSPSLQKSGMIDLLMYNRRMNEILILDYKQNKQITKENKFQKALKPIDHLQDTDISHYGLQLSFYDHIMTIENYFPGIAGYRRGLIHLTPDNYQFIGLESYRYEIKELLKWEQK